MGFIWQLSVVQLASSTLIQGVALEGIPYHFQKNISPLKNLIALIRGYGISVSKNQILKIEFSTNEYEVETNYKGDFKLVVDELISEVPVIHKKGTNEQLSILQNYPILFENRDSSFDVISDLDDTILVSHTANFFKRIGTLAFVQPNKRKVINYSYELYKYFKTKNSRFYYISKSESNLFRVISVIIGKYELPEGVLFLTSYLNLRQLFKPKKGRDFKIDRITYILERTGDKKFIFVGDDSQRDMEIYADAVTRFPERIIKIYIHKTHKKSSSRQKEQLSVLKNSSVPVVYFNRNDDAFDEIKTLKNTFI